MKHDLKLKEKESKELSDLLVEKREALRSARFGTVAARDAFTVRKARKDVARILTEMRTRTTA